MWNPFKKKETVLIPDYAVLWGSCKFDDKYLLETSRTATEILKNINRYEVVQKVTGVPWYLIAAIHYREASLDFSTCLHNGDKLPGPTHNVPAGRGPFSTWEEAAVDALKMEDLPNAWTELTCLSFSERFNGLGYRRKGCLSPYVWAGTSHYKGGLYVSDGKFDSNKFDKRIGVACIIRKLVYAS